MSVPGIVQSSLNGEQVAAQVPLGGDDFLYVTPTRTLIYRADGLLSDESVEEYPHDAERVELDRRRRKATVTLEYGIDGSRSFSVAAKRVEDALHPVLAGVLRAAGVTNPDETVKQTYLFSELTLVVTSERVVKHVGSAVWDDDYEEYHYEDVTGLDVEEGSVADQIVIEVDGRPQRTKAPNDRSRHVHEQVQEALLAFHGVASYAEFERMRAEAAEDDAEEGEDDSDPAAAFGGGVEPLSANPPELDTETGEKVESDDVLEADDASATTGEDASDGSDADPLGGDLLGSIDADGPDGADEPAGPTTGDAEIEATGSDDPTGMDLAGTADEPPGFEGSAFEPAASNLADDTATELARLADAVERQNELLAEQQATIERLIDELSRGR